MQHQVGTQHCQSALNKNSRTTYRRYWEEPIDYFLYTRGGGRVCLAVLQKCNSYPVSMSPLSQKLFKVINQIISPIALFMILFSLVASPEQMRTLLANEATRAAGCLRVSIIICKDARGESCSVKPKHLHGGDPLVAGSTTGQKPFLLHYYIPQNQANYGLIYCATAADSSCQHCWSLDLFSFFCGLLDTLEFQGSIDFQQFLSFSHELTKQQ